jgi:hypothetical protein
MKTLLFRIGHYFVDANDEATLIFATGNATITCYARSTPLKVYLFEKARCFSGENCLVTADDRSKVVARGGTVEAYKESSVEAHIDTIVQAYGKSSVSAHDMVSGCTFDQAKLRAFGATNFAVQSRGTVELRDWAEVEYAPPTSTRSVKFAATGFAVLAAKLRGLADHLPNLNWMDNCALHRFARALDSHEMSTLVAGLEDKKKWRRVLAIPEVQVILRESRLMSW